MGATRPHNPAARGEPLGATAPWQNRSQPKKNKPTLNTKLRILPLEKKTGLSMNLHHYKLVQNLRRWARASGLVALLNRFRRHSSYEAAFSAALRSAIRPGDVVWDVGANIGLYTLQFADWTSPGGLVVAFEPLPSALQELKKAVASSGSQDRIHVVAAALSDAPGTATFTSTTAATNGQTVPTTAHLSDHGHTQLLDIRGTASMIESFISLMTGNRSPGGFSRSIGTPY